MSVLAGEVTSSGPPPVPVQPVEPEPSAPAFLEGVRDAPGQIPPPPAFSKAPEDSDKPLSPQELEEMERRAKIKKYAVIGGAYLFVMIMAVILLFVFKGDKGTEENGESKIQRLVDFPDRKEFEGKLTASMRTEQTVASSIRARNYLKEARKHYERRNMGPENLYLCIKNYKLYLAHLPPGPGNDDPVFEAGSEDESRYKKALDLLLDDVDNILAAVKLLIHQQKWRGASEKLKILVYKRFPKEAMLDHPVMRKFFSESIRSRYIFILEQFESGK